MHMKYELSKVGREGEKPWPLVIRDLSEQAAPVTSAPMKINGHPERAPMNRTAQQKEALWTTGAHSSFLFSFTPHPLSLEKT